MRYLVFGYIGFDNFGDEAIASSLVRKLKSEGAEKITLISSNPTKTSELYGVESCAMLKFFGPLMKSDILISGGGSLLQDVTSFKSLMYYLGVIYFAVIFGKKVEIFAQGIGPIKSKIGQILAKFVLRRVNKITVRDKNSWALLQSWGISSELVKDPIFELDLPQKHQTGMVGVQLRKFNGVNEVFLNKLSKEISSRFSDKKIIILSLQDNIDKDLCDTFAYMLINNGISHAEVLSGLNVNEVIEAISNLEYLISMRFHSNVIGVKSGVKTLAINYDPKVKSLAEEYNLPMINLNDENFSEAFDKL